MFILSFILKKQENILFSSRNNKYTIFLYEQNAQFTKSGSQVLHLLRSTVRLYAFNSFITELQLLLVSSILIVNVGLLFFYAVLQFFLLGRGFHHTLSSKCTGLHCAMCLLFYRNTFMRFEDSTLSERITVCSLLVSWLRAYSRHFEKCQVCEDRLEQTPPCRWRPTAGLSCLRTSCPPPLFCTCWRPFLVYQVHSTALVWTQRCLQCLSVR